MNNIFYIITAEQQLNKNIQLLETLKTMFIK